MGRIFTITASTDDFCDVQGGHLLGVYGYMDAALDPNNPDTTTLFDSATQAGTKIFETKEQHATSNFSVMFPEPIRFTGKLSATIGTGILFVLVK